MLLDLFKAAILGAVQGVTELLPINFLVQFLTNNSLHTVAAYRILVGLFVFGG